MVRTLLDRSFHIVCEVEDREQEEHHIHTGLQGVVTQTGTSIRWKARCWHLTQRRPPGNESDSSQMNLCPQWLSYMYMCRILRRVYKRHVIPTAMRPFQSIRSLLVHPKERHKPQDICECVYNIPCKNCNKTYIGETGRAFGVRFQEHRQEVSQRDVRAYTRNTSRSLAGEQTSQQSHIRLSPSTTS